MFAALISVRFREAVLAASPELSTMRSWSSPDDVQAAELPLAKATEKTLASMHTVLVKTAASRRKELAEGPEEDVEEEQARHLRVTRASEVRVVRYVDDLRHPRLGNGTGSATSLKAVAIDRGQTKSSAVDETK